MVTILSAVVSIFAFRFRSRASLELKLIALQHQLAVLRRQRPDRPQLSSLDRLLWVWLYRIWPQVIDAMILVKPATVVQWHRKGFRLHWRWRSRRPGPPKIGTEIRGLIRRKRHLRRVLSSYFQYHHEARTHLSLNKDCPWPRPVQLRSASHNIIALPEVGGLHHRYSTSRPE